MLSTPTSWASASRRSAFRGGPALQYPTEMPIFTRSPFLASPVVPSLVEVVGRALLQESRHGLAVVLGEGAQDLRPVLQVDTGAETRDLEIRPEHLLGHPDAHGAVGRD